MMNPRLEPVFARRSIRQYTDQPVTAEEIQILLEAGMAAPSASNRRPWHMVTVTDRRALAALAEAHPHGKMTAHAAVAIAVCGDPAISPRFWIQDCAAATENILIAATALGLGAVWLGCHPNEDQEQAVRSVLRIPDEIGVLSLIAIGRPAEEKPPRTQYDPARDHRDRW
jgi:nitroreductase